MFLPKGSARCFCRPSMGWVRDTRACMAKPMNATMARRPFLTSLTACLGEFRPTGSKGKELMKPLVPVSLKPWKRLVSRKPITRNRMGTWAWTGRSYSAAPASYHLAGTPSSSWPRMPVTAIMAHLPFVFSASTYHLRRSSFRPRPSGSKPESPGRVPFRWGGGMTSGSQSGLLLLAFMTMREARVGLAGLTPEVVSLVLILLVRAAILHSLFRRTKK
mmetsp:Transcript_14293/g.38780  ORF Transcript_14293/g.38780 Transcript_14293/m.38780 type:complete len:218 (-) Transcript_14293:55-708(-)